MKIKIKSTKMRLQILATLIATAIGGCIAESLQAIPPEPECANDTECVAIGDCWNAACVGGECVQTSVSGRACLTDAGAGVCNYGECRFQTPCMSANDCPGHDCADAACVHTVCAWTRRPNGWTCFTDAGAEGVCNEGLCVK